MKTLLQVATPGEIEFTLTITMKLKDWKELHKQMQSSWPASDLRSSIRDMVSRAERTFYPMAPKDEEPDGYEEASEVAHPIPVTPESIRCVICSPRYGRRCVLPDGHKGAHVWEPKSKQNHNCLFDPTSPGGKGD